MDKTRAQLDRFKTAMQKELTGILQFWMDHAVDDLYGGFYGQIDSRNKAQPLAAKGSVLNSRILWTFSAAFNQTKNGEYLIMADRAYQYLIHHFLDEAFDGVYWTVDHQGHPLDTKKQVYALAFAVYGLSEYYKCAQIEEAKNHAVRLFQTIERHSFDPTRTGYIDAFARDWSELDDIRLSAKDANEKKTMNTHLHILEAYTNLYSIWPDTTLNESIRLLIENFSDHIIDPRSHHLILFFNENWHPKSEVISFGHDIEASWLIQEAAAAVGDQQLLQDTKRQSLQIADAATEGLSADGGLWYEKDGDGWVKEKHWWPQAEAMVGFMNAYENSGDENYLHHALNAWNFITLHIKSPEGEWWWGVNPDNSVMQGQDKTGLWKCPYHNSRACLEVWKRIERLGESVKGPLS